MIMLNEMVEQAMSIIQCPRYSLDILVRIHHPLDAHASYFCTSIIANAVLVTDE